MGGWTAGVREFRSFLCLFNGVPKAGSHQQAPESRRILHGGSLPAFPRYWGHSPVQVPANELPLGGASSVQAGMGWGGATGSPEDRTGSRARVRSEGQLGGERRGQRRASALGPGTWRLALPPVLLGGGFCFGDPSCLGVPERGVSGDQPRPGRGPAARRPPQESLQPPRLPALRPAPSPCVPPVSPSPCPPQAPLPSRLVGSGAGGGSGAAVTGLRPQLPGDPWLFPVLSPPGAVY